MESLTPIGWSSIRLTGWGSSPAPSPSPAAPPAENELERQSQILLDGMFCGVHPDSQPGSALLTFRFTLLDATTQWQLSLETRPLDPS